MFALVRGEKGVWLQEAGSVVSRYRAGQMEWSLTDPAWGATRVEVVAVPAAEGVGCALRVRVIGGQAGDRLVFASGGAMRETEDVLAKYDLTTAGRLDRLTRGFSPESCKQETVSGGASTWALRLAGVAEDKGTVGRCSEPVEVVAGEASAWKEPAGLVASKGAGLPIACGAIALAGEGERDVYFTLDVGAAAKGSPAEAFAAGMARTARVRDIVHVETPDPQLDAAVSASASVIDGVFRNGVYTHSGMRWGVPLLGWRTMFGGTVYGQHANVLTEARLAIAKQVKSSDRASAEPDASRGLASQGPESRLFGKGRVDFHQPDHYDMQTQFFDQLIHAWESTGDPELEKLLRPALELHLEYVRECFDPAGTGTYESYANTWPTDDQWYNGGGTSEETAYVYRGELAAGRMAERAGDVAGAKAHRALAEKIRAAFSERLWAGEHGHPGAYREQGGLGRLHESGWLYAIFCPIDAGLLDPFQAAQALDYTEWGLERIDMPYGGQQCWTSNWVPSVWSLREMWPGDNYHLALACFQAGKPEEGWRLLRGTFPQQAFFGPVPGDLGHPAGATDFNDCVSMFSRATVEGLFGYRPDYPAGVVTFAPGIPAAWGHASIRTSDFSLGYQSTGGTTSVEVTLSRAAGMVFEIPVAGEAVEGVTVNGAPAKFEVAAGWGRTVVRVAVPSGNAAKVEVKVRGSMAPVAPVHVAAESGTAVSLGDNVVELRDPQHAIADARVEGGAIHGTWARGEGDHLVFGRVKLGDMEQWREFKVKLRDPAAEAEVAARAAPPVTADATWQTVDMASVLNADVRTIFRQKYLSPRPNTCSLRLAEDGYGTWQMVLEKKYKVPEIGLGNVPGMLDARGQLVTKDGLRFRWTGDGKNIAFASLWDNWPRKVEVPVNLKGDAAWFLVCGSTNPMQVRIANARILLHYASGATENVDLVPPFNFWSLCKFGNADYDYAKDFFCLPAQPPLQVQLGENCRAMLVGTRLKKGEALERVELEALSQEVVIGLMGVSVMTAPAR
jgi:hypothetical protein